MPISTKACDPRLRRRQIAPMNACSDSDQMHVTAIYSDQALDHKRPHMIVSLMQIFLARPTASRVFRICGRRFFQGPWPLK